MSYDICANVLSHRYANSDVTLFFPVWLLFSCDIFSVEDATELAGVPTDCLWADLGILFVSWVDPTASAHAACKWYFLPISHWTLASTSRPHLIKPAISADCSAIAFSRFDMQLFKMDHIYINIVIRPEVVAWSRTATAAVPTETFSRGAHIYSNRWWYSRPAGCIFCYRSPHVVVIEALARCSRHPFLLWGHTAHAVI